MNRITAEVMNAGERKTLCEAVKMRARVAKSDIEKRAAFLRADAEQQLSASFSAQDDEWADITRMAKDAAEAADAEVGRRCEELGIRAEFRPHIETAWMGRGANATRERRAELRMLAAARIDAAAKDAKHGIERWQADTITKLLTGTLQSAEAMQFLSDMPTADALLPPLALAQLDSLATKPGLKLVEGRLRIGSDDYA